MTQNQSLMLRALLLHSWAIALSAAAIVVQSISEQHHGSFLIPNDDVCPWNVRTASLPVTVPDIANKGPIQVIQPSQTSDALIDCIQHLNTTNQSLLQCQAATDRYLFGELDATLRFYQQLNHTQHVQLQLQTQQLRNLSQRRTRLETQNTQLLSNNTQLSAQLIYTLELQQNASQTELQRITASLHNVADIFSKSALERQRIEELEKQLFSYRQDIEYWQHSHNNLSQTFQTLSSEKQALRHELGECHVEFGVKEHELRQCYAGADTLQKEVEKVNHKFTNCTKVTRDCKMEKKKVSDEHRMQRRDLLNCTRNAEIAQTDVHAVSWVAWIQSTAILVAAVVLCGVAAMIVGYRYIEHAMEEKHACSVKEKQQCMDECSALKQKLKVRDAELAELKFEKQNITNGCDALNENFKAVQCKVKDLEHELDNKEQQIRQLIDTHSSCSNSRDSPNDMVHINAEESTPTVN